MKKLTDLLACAWDIIMDSGVIEKRPRLPEGGNVNKGAPYAYEQLLKKFPVVRYLETSLTIASQCGFSRFSILLRESAEFLIWSQNPTYTEVKLGDHFMSNYVWGGLTGIDAPIAPEFAPSGVLLLGPNTEYPEHSHAPGEVYLNLSPGVEWRLNGKAWFHVKPGEVIYHAPNQTHAMRTHEMPMLAFAAWLEKGRRASISI